MTFDDEVQRLADACRALSESGVVRLEALWDGDSGGWFLCLEATLPSSDGATRTRHVDTLRYGGDIRLFQGTAPTWTESAIVQRLADVLGCELWFPSPDRPDDSCPSYAERHDAVACPDCGRLQRGNAWTIERFGTCYGCSLARDHRARLREEPRPPGEGFSMWVLSRLPRDDDLRLRLRTSTVGRYGRLLVELLRETGDAVPDTDNGRWIDGLRLEQPRLHRMVELLDIRLDELMAEHQPPHPRWPRTVAVTWRGRRVRTMSGAPLRSALDLREQLEEATELLLLTNHGVAYRDVHVLLWLRGQDEPPPQADAVAQWADAFGSTRSVHESLARLKAAGCIEAGDPLGVTAKGRLVDDAQR